MIATTIGQSKHLLELGLDASTADMYYLFGNPLALVKWIKSDVHLLAVTDIPAWSLSALLEVMPLGTELYKMHNDDKGMYYEINSPDEEGWIGYEDIDPVTAAYEMVCYLLEQGLIEKGDNDESES